MKAQTLLLLLVVAITPSLVCCGVKVFNGGERLRIEQEDGFGEVCSAVFIAQRLLTRVAR